MGRGYPWGSFLIAAAALKTPTRNGHNAQGVNLNFQARPCSLSGLTLEKSPIPREINEFSFQGILQPTTALC